MRPFCRSLHVPALAALLISLFAGAAVAQDAVTDREELRAAQDQAFERMFAKPDDLELMFRYAVISIQLEDLEAAISTLERMLIYNRDLPRVHMELGAAYYRLGSYKTAKYYFANVLSFPDVPSDVRAKAEEFQASIDDRTKPTVVAGSVGAGIVYASNATLGPDDPSVLLFGVDAVLDDAFLEADDAAIRATAQIAHIVDLDRPNGDVWKTDLSAFALHYFSESSSDIDSLQLRTGPILSVDSEQYGPKIRPLIEGDYVRSGNDALYATIGIGAEFQNTLSNELALFGVGRVGYRGYFNGRDDFDALLIRGSFGAAFAARPDLTLRGTALAERRDARDDVNSLTEIGLRGVATYTYDSGYDGATRYWSLSAFIQGALRLYDEADPVLVGADSGRVRRDIDLRGGVSHIFYLDRGVWISAEIDGLIRDSNIRNFDLDNLGGGVSVGVDF